MQLNCKVIKKRQLPHFYITPPPHFQGYPSFLGKFLVPPSPRPKYSVLVFGRSYALWGVPTMDVQAYLLYFQLAIICRLTCLLKDYQAGVLLHHIKE